MIDHDRLDRLVTAGGLLDEAIDIADAAGHALLAAQIAQAIHTLDLAVAALHPAPGRQDRPAIHRGPPGR